MLVNASNLAKIYNGKTLFSHVSFAINPGEKIGLVGINGAGKTTLLKMLMQQLTPDEGEIFCQRDARISYMQQYACADSERTLYQEVLDVFAPVMAMEQQLKQIRQDIDSKTGDLGKLVQQQYELNQLYEQSRGFTYRNLVRSCLLGLSFTEAELELSVSALSGGQRTRAVLAKILLSDSNLLLLDEPTNHLDIASVGWLEDFLQTYNGAILVISHDRYFLDKVTNRTFELECGRFTAYTGNYSKYLQLKEESEKTRLRTYNNTMAEITRLEAVVKEQKRWNKEKSIKQAESKEKQIERLSQTLDQVQHADNDLNFSFNPDRRGGNDVLEVTDVAKAFDGQQLFSGLNLRLQRGERAFLLGPNGCGKTTLLKLILQQLSPDCGTIRLGSSIDVAYYEQTGASLLQGKDILNEVWDAFPKLPQTQVRKALAAFLFRGEEVFKEISMLSGGERARVALLKILMQRGNLLLLDEPTNHLDITARVALEQSLQQYEGTILCVSHDRYFINKLATVIYDFDGGHLQAYQGDYDNYLAQRGTGAAVEEVKIESAGSLDYKAQKEEESRKRKAAARLARCEQQIDDCEKAVSTLHEELSRPEVATDYTRALKITEQIDELERQLTDLLGEWEELSAN